VRVCSIALNPRSVERLRDELVSHAAGIASSLNGVISDGSSEDLLQWRLSVDWAPQV
jgi:hypothetical protein